MAGTNLRSRDGLPFNFVNGLKVRGVDIEELIPGIEGIPEAGTKYQFAGNGSNTIFTLPVTPYNKDAIEVHVKQLYVHSSDYTLVGDVVTLNEAPPALDVGETYNVEIKVTLTTLNGYVNANRVSFEGENLDDILEKGKPLANYSALRAYAGNATQIRITEPNISGFFRKVPDAGQTDNGGTVIVGSTVSGVKYVWERVFDGAVNVRWFGAKGDGITDVGPLLRALIQNLTADTHLIFDSGTYLLSPVSDSTYCLLLDKDIKITLNNATFKAASNTRAVIKISVPTTQDWSDLTVDGDYKTNFGIELASNGISITGARAINFYAHVVGFAAAAYYGVHVYDTLLESCFAGNVRAKPNSIVGDSVGVASGFLLLGTAPVFGKNTISNCIVDNIYNNESVNYEDEDGINVQVTNTHTLVTGNTLKRCMKRGIKMMTSGTISKNYIYSDRGKTEVDSAVMYSGISIYSDNVIACDNFILSSENNGSYLYLIEIGGAFGARNVFIHNNKLILSAASYSSNLIGIYAVGDTSNLSISNNTITLPTTAGSKYGIRSYTNTEFLVEQFIFDNVITNTSYGVWAQGAVTGRISGNVFKDGAFGVAIYIDRGSVGTFPIPAANITFLNNVAEFSGYCVRIQDTSIAGCLAIGNRSTGGIPVLINGKHTEIASSNRVSSMYAAAPSSELVTPSTNQFVRGDIVINADCRDTSPVRAWVCRYGNTAGASATWSVAGFMLMRGPTVSRPVLTSSDMGVQYLDTTLAAAGKPIWWTGFAWVDATGTTV